MEYLLLFTSTAGLSVVINTITEFIKLQWPSTKPYIQYISWGIGILLAIICQLLGIGMFVGITWLQTIILGLGSGMVSNGTFDTGLVDWIVSLFKPKKTLN